MIGLLNPLRKVRNFFLSKIRYIIFDKKQKCDIQFPIKNIAVIRWDGKFGDSIVSSFFYREIRKSKDVKITVITTKKLVSLYKNDFVVDDVIVVDEKSTYSSLWNLAKKLKGIDTIIHPVKRLSTKDLFFISRVKPNNVFSLDNAYNFTNVPMLEETKDVSFHYKYIYMLEKMGITDVDDSYIIPVQSAQHSKSYDIVFNPFGNATQNSLSVDKSVETLRLIGDQYPKLAIGILSSPNTKKLAKRIYSLTDKKNISIIDDINTFDDAIKVVSDSTLTISVDTAIIHIASGLDKKLVGIYATPLWLPKLSSKTKIIFSEQYSTKSKFQTMNNFNVDQVVDGIDSLIECCREGAELASVS